MTHHETFEHHEHPGTSPVCKVCSSSYYQEHPASLFGFCHHCMYKILILIVIVMVVISYVAWFGVF